MDDADRRPSGPRSDPDGREHLPERRKNHRYRALVDRATRTELVTGNDGTRQLRFADGVVWSLVED